MAGRCRSGSGRCRGRARERQDQRQDGEECEQPYSEHGETSCAGAPQRGHHRRGGRGSARDDICCWRKIGRRPENCTAGPRRQYSSGSVPRSFFARRRELSIRVSTGVQVTYPRVYYASLLIFSEIKVDGGTEKSGRSGFMHARHTRGAKGVGLAAAVAWTAKRTFTLSTAVPGRCGTSEPSGRCSVCSDRV